MLLGYARVSTKEQNLNRQIDKLIEFGVEDRHIFKEKITGSKSDRKEYKKLMEYIKPGDKLVVAELTRLGRSTKELINIMEQLKANDIELISLKENIDTTTSTGKLIFNMFSILAEFERDLIVERTKEGLKSARARGRLGGRPKAKKENIERAKYLYSLGTMSITDICTMCNISKSTLYNYMKGEGVGEGE